METALELYPDYAKSEKEYGSFYGPGSYQPILDSFGKILVQVDDNDYQGDSRVLYKNGNKYGWLQFGWGSCSGCDSLQACSTIKEIQELIDDLYRSIKWFNTKKQLLDFFKNHDWEGDYSGRSNEQKDFINKVNNLFV